MDAFAVAEQMLGDITLSSSQIAELRAINYQYWLRVSEMTSAAGGGPPDRPLTAAETAELHAMVVARLDAMLTPEQRAAAAARRG
jgi:hypothetical protein